MMTKGVIFSSEIRGWGLVGHGNSRKFGELRRESAEGAPVLVGQVQLGNIINAQFQIQPASDLKSQRLEIAAISVAMSNLTFNRI